MLINPGDMFVRDAYKWTATISPRFRMCCSCGEAEPSEGECNDACQLRRGSANRRRFVNSLRNSFRLLLRTTSTVRVDPVGVNCVTVCWRAMLQWWRSQRKKVRKFLPRQEIHGSPNHGASSTYCLLFTTTMTGPPFALMPNRFCASFVSRYRISYAIWSDSGASAESWLSGCSGP